MIEDQRDRSSSASSRPLTLQTSQKSPGTTLRVGAGASALRRLLRDEAFIVAPGVHDMFALRAIEDAGFASAAISGAVMSQAMLGMPDIGLLTLDQSVEHCRRLVRAARIPITADADAGFGNPMGVRYSVQLFEEAGAAGVNIEDQVVPRRWAGAPGKEVVSMGEMVAKIEAAVKARRDGDFVLIVRTDAFACETLAQVLERARAYEAAGADLLMPIGPPDGTAVACLVESLDIPVSINVGNGLEPAASAGRLSIPCLRALGVRRVSLPQLLPSVGAAAMQRGLAALQGIARTGQGAASALDDLALADLRQLMRDADGLALEEGLLHGGQDARSSPVR